MPLAGLVSSAKIEAFMEHARHLLRLGVFRTVAVPTVHHIFRICIALGHSVHSSFGRLDWKHEFFAP
jgi:hypothetical protein